MQTVHLYNPKDVANCRTVLLKEQKGLDLLTGLPLNPKDAVCDHSHKTQYVRGIIHRQANAVLGKIENLWTRYLSFWYTEDLQTFLRKTADYLDREQDSRYVHPKFQQKLQTMFNSLTEGSKRAILGLLGQPEGSNGVERKKLFKSLLAKKQHTFEELKELIEKEKSK